MVSTCLKSYGLVYSVKTGWSSIASIAATFVAAKHIITAPAEQMPLHLTRRSQQARSKSEIVLLSLKLLSAIAQIGLCYIEDINVLLSKGRVSEHGFRECNRLT